MTQNGQKTLGLRHSLPEDGPGEGPVKETFCSLIGMPALAPAWKGNNSYMGKGYRKDRLGEEIRKIISEMLISGSIKDPRLSGMLSLSGVEVTNDGSYATCYVSLLGMNQDQEARQKEETDVLVGLQSAKGLFKREIGRQVKLRHIPELLFKIDHSMEYGRHITEIIGTLGIENYQSDEEEAAEGAAVGETGAADAAADTEE